MTRSFGKVNYMFQKLALLFSALVLLSHGASAQSSGADVRLAAGQQVQVTVFQQPDLSGQYAIDSNGILSMQLIGDVKAAGLTTRQLEQQIRTKLIQADYLRNPQVTVDIASYGSFFVTGEVNKAGAYEFDTRMTISQALATAGGISFRGQKKYVCLKRDGGDEIAETDGNCSDDGGVKVKKKFHATTFIQPGDVITVKERYF